MKKSTSFNLILSSLLFFVLIFTTNAQLQNANWFFGKGAGLNFNDGSQAGTILTNSAMSSVAGCATVSDVNGELLFYTNGRNIWTKNHEPMKGTGLLFGSPDVSQSVVIVPSPNDINKYYVFTNEGFIPDSHGLSYSVVDMSLQNGSGQVDEYQFNEPLLKYSSEKLTTVFNPDDNSYWIIAFAPSSEPTHSDTFYTFKLDENGVNLHCQSTHYFLPDALTQTGGQMKISPDGTTLGMVHNTVIERESRITNFENIFSFDFKMNTGEIHSKKSYTIENALYCYGLEFSPNSEEIFVTTTHQINIKDALYNIYQICYRGLDSDYYPVQFVGSCESPMYSLQLGIDNIIHVASYMTGYLYCFTNPDGHSQNASYSTALCYLNGKFSAKGLPQLVPQQVATLKPVESKMYTIMENPFEEELEIKFHVKKPFNLKIYNMSGRRIKNKHINISFIGQEIEIDLEDQPDGIYQLVIKDKETKQRYNETVLKVDD